jgi:hypothetical protein
MRRDKKTNPPVLRAGHALFHDPVYALAALQNATVRPPFGQGAGALVE